jgi:FMN phosphatase YigB (HAD superfamily)
MNKIEGIIFDLDGSLYAFDNGTAETFSQSRFSRQIGQNCIRFFQDRFDLNEVEATRRFKDLVDRFEGEVSLGLEKEHGILRSEYFEATWDLDPAEFMQPNKELAATLRQVTVRRALLSAAPNIWITKALAHLQLTEVFTPAIFNGEPDIRKPNPEAFLQVAKFWNIAPENILAIGDQEKTDILPAQAVGMRTLRIGNDPTTKADFMAPDALCAITLLQQEKLL